MATVIRILVYFGSSPISGEGAADAFPNDELTDREIDALYEAEMERRDRENGDDEPPTPPPAGSPGSIMSAAFGCYSDDDLVIAVDCADRGAVQNITAEQREQLVYWGTAEILRRLDARRAA